MRTQRMAEQQKGVRTWMLVLCLPAFIALAVPLNAQPSFDTGADRTQKEHVRSSNDHDKRGKELRHAIDDAYTALSRSNSIKSLGNGSNLITDVVLTYVPIGTSFDDAEAILRAAGFKVGPRGKNPVVRDFYETSAEIAEYAPTLFGRTSVYVSLQRKRVIDDVWQS
jgi:hypothetical protein